jgi:hypothetical protein
MLNYNMENTEDVAKANLTYTTQVSGYYLSVIWTQTLDVNDRTKEKTIGKEKLSLCLTKHHAMKKYWGWRNSATQS